MGLEISAQWFRQTNFNSGAVNTYKSEIDAYLYYSNNVWANFHDTQRAFHKLCTLKVGGHIPISSSMPSDIIIKRCKHV